MIVNNVELKDLDLFDSDTARVYEQAIKNFDLGEKTKNVELSLEQTIIQECRLVFKFFDEIWGEGTAKKVFGGKTNFRTCQNAFKTVIEYSNSQLEELKGISAQYSKNRIKRK